MLLGQTLDGMRVWDIRRAIQALRSLEATKELPLTLKGDGTMGVNVLYASLFEPEVAGIELARIPLSHAEGPDYLNVLRFLDIPQAAAMAAEHSPVILRQREPDRWDFPASVLKMMGRSSFQVEESPAGR
jgi:hypothetical protein